MTARVRGDEDAAPLQLKAKVVLKAKCGGLRADHPTIYEHFKNFHVSVVDIRGAFIV